MRLFRDYLGGSKMPSHLSFSGTSVCNAGDPRRPGSIPGLGRSPGEGNGSPLQFSFLFTFKVFNIIVIGKLKAKAKCQNKYCVSKAY